MTQKVWTSYKRPTDQFGLAILKDSDEEPFTLPPAPQSAPGSRRPRLLFSANSNTVKSTPQPPSSANGTPRMQRIQFTKHAIDSMKEFPTVDVTPPSVVTTWPTTSASSKPVLLQQVEANIRKHRLSSMSIDDRKELYVSSMKTFISHFPLYADILTEIVDFFDTYFQTCNKIFDEKKAALIEETKKEYDAAVVQPMHESLEAMKLIQHSLEDKITELVSWKTDTVKELTAEISQKRKTIEILTDKCLGENRDMTVMKGRLLLLHERQDGMQNETHQLHDKMRNYHELLTTNRNLVSENAALIKQVEGLTKKAELNDLKLQEAERLTAQHACIKRTKLDILARERKELENTIESLKKEIARGERRLAESERRREEREQQMRDMENKVYAIRSQNLTPRPDFEEKTLITLGYGQALETPEGKPVVPPRTKVIVQNMQSSFLDALQRIDSMTEELNRLKKIVAANSEIAVLISGPKKTLTTTPGGTLPCLVELDDDSVPAYLLSVNRSEVTNEEWSLQMTQTEAKALCEFMNQSSGVALSFSDAVVSRVRHGDLVTYGYNLTHYLEVYQPYSALCSLVLYASNQQLPWQIYSVMRQFVDKMKSAFEAADKLNRSQLHMRIATQVVNDVFQKRGASSPLDSLLIRAAMARDINAFRSNYVSYHKLSMTYSVVENVILAQYSQFYDRLFGEVAVRVRGGDFTTRVTMETLVTSLGIPEAHSAIYVDLLFHAVPGDVVKVDHLIQRIRSTFVPITSFDAIGPYGR